MTSRCGWALGAQYKSATILAVSIVALTCQFSPAGAFEDGYHLEIEAGGAWQSRNNAQSPTSTGSFFPQGTRFSLIDLQGTEPNPYFRLSAGYSWGGRHQVHMLYAPLSITGTGSFAVSVAFQGANFAPNTATEGRYRFNSYRIGYRYKFLDRAEWQLWGGLTLKLRDANIALTQGDIKANREDVGIVPLLSFYAQRRLGTQWAAILDVEGLAAPQGRALDAAIKFRRQLSAKAGVSLGYRMLEGGADNDKVYTFAWLNYGLVSVDYRF
jgi:hypothetical protein